MTKAVSYLYSYDMQIKKYIIIIGGIILLILLFFIFLHFYMKMRTTHSKVITSMISEIKPVGPNGYAVADVSFSPQKPNDITQGEVIREVYNKNGTYIETFFVKSPINNTYRAVYSTNDQSVKFESIGPQNWSPTSRFLYVYMDYPGRRSILFIKLDGTFTSGNYSLDSFGIYPDLTINSVQWIDQTTLKLSTTNIKTHKTETYIGDFDDDTGTVIPESVYNSPSWNAL